LVTQAVSQYLANRLLQGPHGLQVFPTGVVFDGPERMLGVEFWSTAIAIERVRSWAVLVVKLVVNDRVQEILEGIPYFWFQRGEWTHSTVPGLKQVVLI